MSTTSAVPAGAPEPQGSAPARAPSEVAGQSPGTPSPPEEPASSLRLVIEEDKAANSFVYKTVDARTGQVIQQIPREEVLRMRSTTGYSPGDVIDARG